MIQPILKVENYLLIVSDGDLKEKDYYLDDTFQIRKAIKSEKDWSNSGKNGYIICKKIIAHIPLNNAQVLEAVELLPELNNKDYFLKKSELYFPSYPDGIVTDEILALREGFIKGFSIKSYSEEDIKIAMLKMFDMCLTNRTSDINYIKFIDDHVQSIKPNYPTFFDTETKQYIY
jgi:hypothetical protein